MADRQTDSSDLDEPSRRRGYLGWSDDQFHKKGAGTYSINNKRLLELFGFDRFDERGNQTPDGKFDDLIGYNYESETAEIIFPVIEPFGENIPPELSEYKYDWIYDTTKTFLSLPDNYFVIKGKYSPR